MAGIRSGVQGVGSSEVHQSVCVGGGGAKSLHLWPMFILTTKHLVWMWPPLSHQSQFASSGTRGTAKGPAANTYTSVQSAVAHTGETSATLSDGRTESWARSWTLM